MKTLEKRIEAKGKNSSKHLPMSSRIKVADATNQGGGGTGDNFATADLIFTGSRTHSGNGLSLELRDMSSVDFNVQEFNSLTDTLDMTNNNTGYQVFNGVDPLFGVPCVAFRAVQDINNYALNYIKDLGGFAGLGILRVRDDGGPSQQFDTIAIDDDTMLFEQTILDAGVNYQNTLRHDKETLVIEHQDDIGAIQVIAGIYIDRSSYYFGNNNNIGFKFPIAGPTEEGQALVADISGACSWQKVAVEGFTYNVETQLPGTYNGVNHYRVTLASANGTDGDQIWSPPAGVTSVYKIEAMTTDNVGWEQPIPYVNHAPAEYANLAADPADRQVYIRTNLVNAVYRDITIFYTKP